MAAFAPALAKVQALEHILSEFRGIRMGAVKESNVKGGWVARDPRTGRFIAVTSKTGTKKSSASSVTVLKRASEKRKDALKRLADR